MRLAMSMLDAADVHQLRVHLLDAAWTDGRQTAGWLAREVKDNLQAELDETLRQRLRAQILAHELVVNAARPVLATPPLFNAYRSGMQYGAHTDDTWIGGVRTDLAYTLFLSEPEEYGGGELVIEDSAGSASYKLPAGSMLLYDCGQLHRVNPVTHGTRLAAIGWIQSRVQDPAMRADLFDLAQVRHALSSDPARHDEVRLLGQISGRLLRRYGQ